MDRLFSRPASNLRDRLRRPSQPITDQLQFLWQRHQILDPSGEIVTWWNHVFLVTSILALFIDPLYFYTPYVGAPGCMSNDTSLGVAITFFRTLADLFYVLHMSMKFRTAFIAPSSRVFGRGELVMDPNEITMRYLKSDFIIDLAAALPLPQIVIWIVIPATKNSRADYANNTLALIVLIQYIPRLFLIFPLNQKIIKTTGVIAKTAWAGAAYNLLLYTLASHVLGAVWYLSSIARQHSCWRLQCSIEKNAPPYCAFSYLDCTSLPMPSRIQWLNATQVISHCDAKNDDSNFKFGMFAEAFTNEVASAEFSSKYLYCLWWGLRNLSSYGQNISTSTYIGETAFCITICLIGLVLFAQLIGQMQSYLASMTVRLEEWRVKRRDTEEWMRHRQLPPELQERVRRFVQYKWIATRGVNEESILLSLPLDLRREIQRHLCLQLVRRVSVFNFVSLNKMSFDSFLLPGSILFTNGRSTVRRHLRAFSFFFKYAGDVYCPRRRSWALMPNSSLNLPSSTRTVRTVTEVEAFALRAEDLKFVANQFKRLHSKKLQHAFRYYSHQWRTWGACFIQAAWRRYKKRKLAKELAQQESEYYDKYMGMEDGESDDDMPGNYGDDDDGGGSSMNNPRNPQNLGTTFLASKFAANARRGMAKVQIVESASSLKMPKLFKPNEPDFFRDDV